MVLAIKLLVYSHSLIHLKKAQKTLIEIAFFNDRRVIAQIAQICFLFQLMKRNIQSKPLLNEIGLNTYQRNLRNYELLVIDYNDTDPYNVMRQKFNEYSKVIELNKISDVLKKNLKQLLDIIK